ncbi:MAG: hypothetical protein HY313_00565 [Acidobacteria bacterium]|nr:hypothetical protein [Acidobacteriota bacterium]
MISTKLSTAETINENEGASLAAWGHPEALAAKMKALGIDTKSEEARLQEQISELVVFAQSKAEEVPAIQLPNSILVISSTEWQALLSSYPAGEKSFRADLSRGLRRAIGLLAMLQEESALYRVRQTSEHLWKKHLNTLVYLSYCASKLLPELEKLLVETQNRGLSRKAEHLGTIIARMRRYLEEVSDLGPQQEETGRGVRIDPKWEENRLQTLLNHLIAFAKGSAEPVPEIPLSKTVLAISATQWQALVSERPPGEESFREKLNQVLQRAVGLLGAIQEQLAAYHANADGKFSWKMPLNSLRYLSHCASEILPKLEALVGEAERRILSAKAEDLSRTVTLIRQYQAEIDQICQQHIGSATSSPGMARAASAGA